MEILRKLSTSTASIEDKKVQKVALKLILQQKCTQQEAFKTLKVTRFD